MSNSKWIRVLKSSNNPAMHLVCFPYAGGGASVFHGWAKLLPNHITLNAVQYPGRENRISEKPYTYIADIVPAIIENIGSILNANEPVYFFGHSLGAMIAYETVKALGANAPKMLMVSGARAPHIPPREDQFHGLPVRQFWDKVAEMQGTPQAILENEEFRNLLEPMLRADFQMAETYHNLQKFPLSCPMVAFCGTHDEHVSIDDMRAWSGYTASAFNMHRIQGGHFFMNENPQSVLTILTNYMR